MVRATCVLAWNFLGFVTTAAVVAVGLGVGLAPRMAEAGGGPQNVLVVINTQSRDSVEVGEYYVNKRDIPAVNVCRITCPTDLTVPYTVAKTRILDPVRRHIQEKGIAGHIDYIVTTQGMPIRVNVGGAGGHFSLVSLQWLLCLMDTAIAGEPQERQPKHRNPYFATAKSFRNADTYGSNNWRMYLVTSLQAYTVADAKALVDRAIASDAGPKGRLFLFQDADGNASGRNAQYPQGMDLLRRAGMQVEHAPSGPDAVTERKGVMGYISGGVYSRLNVAKMATNEFVPGAMIDPLQSFGAVPENFDPARGTQFPVTHFIRHGATIVHGCVAEPYTLAFPPATLFSPYVEGYNAAECFYMLFTWAYWMNMVIGDPLTQPFATRPVVEITNADDLENPVRDSFTVRFGPGPNSPEIIGYEIYLDGIRLHRLPGSARQATIDTSKLKNGEHDLRVVAIGAGSTATQAYKKAFVSVENTRLFVVSHTPAVDAGNVMRQAPIRIEFNRPLTGEDKRALEFLVRATTGDVRGSWTIDDEAGMARFLPADVKGWPAGEDVSVTVSRSHSRLLSAAFHTTIDAIGLAIPSETVAGQPVRVTVTALRPDGSADRKYTGRVAVALGDPRADGTVNRAFAHADGGTWAQMVEFRTAGQFEVSVRDDDAGVSARATITVQPGPFSGVQIVVADKHPLGAPLTVNLVAGDRFGNRIESATYAGTLEIQTHDGRPIARRPVSLVPGMGRGVVRDLILPAVGRYVARLDSGARAEFEVEDRGVPHGLLIGPFPGRYAEVYATAQINEAEPPGMPGAIEAKSGHVWRAYETPSGQTFVDLNTAFGGQQNNCACYAMVYVESPRQQIVNLLLGSDDGAKVWVNGQLVHSVEAGRAYQADQDRVPGIRLRAGLNHFLFKIAQGGGGFAYGFRLAGDDGKTIADLIYRLNPAGEPALCTVSGFVRIGRDPLPDARLSLREIVNGQPRGSSRSARTDARGLYRFDNLANGIYEVICEVRDTKPARQIVVVLGEHVPNVDFDAPDVLPPTVRFAGAIPAPVLAETTVEVVAEDNAGIRSLQFFVNGRPFGPLQTDAPFAITIGPESLGAGRHELKAVATDTSGNVGESEAVRVEVRVDRRRPTITLGLPRRWVGPSEVSIRVRDDSAVRHTEVFLNGKSIHRTTDEDFTITIDCNALERGRHQLVVECHDVAGNIARRTQTFSTR